VGARANHIAAPARTHERHPRPCDAMLARHHHMSGEMPLEEAREDECACSETLCGTTCASSLIASAASLAARWRLATGVCALTSPSHLASSHIDCAEVGTGEPQRRLWAKGAPS